MKKYLAIDIGGTIIKYAIMDESYGVYEEQEQLTQKEPGLFLQQLKDIIDYYRNIISGTAISMGGFIHPGSGQNTDFSVGTNFRTYNLKHLLSEYAGLPVIVENDSNCAAIGEMVMGAGKGCSNICLITLGTGIGGAIIINGQLYRGSHYKAGEAGLTYVAALDAQNPMGCEQAGATSVLVKKVSQTIGKQVDGLYIFNHLEEPAIHEVYQQWLGKVAIVTGNMAILLDPEKMLIGGGISRQKVFIEDLSRKTYELYPHLEEYTQIISCEQGNNAGKIGALYQLINGA